MYLSRTSPYADPMCTCSRHTTVHEIGQNVDKTAPGMPALFCRLRPPPSLQTPLTTDSTLHRSLFYASHSFSFGLPMFLVEAIASSSRTWKLRCPIQHHSPAGLFATGAASSQLLSASPCCCSLPAYGYARGAGPLVTVLLTPAVPPEVSPPAVWTLEGDLI
jgi:hypothetical protein